MTDWLDRAAVPALAAYYGHDDAADSDVHRAWMRAALAAGLEALADDPDFRDALTDAMLLAYVPSYARDEAADAVLALLRDGASERSEGQ